MSTGFIGYFRQAKIDDLRGHGSLFLKAHHNIAWLDIPVNQALFVHRRQTRGDLPRNFQSQFHVKPTRALDEVIESFSLDKLHRVEVVAPLSAQVEDGGDVGMTHTRGGTRFPEKPYPRRLVTRVFR